MQIGTVPGIAPRSAPAVRGRGDAAAVSVPHDRHRGGHLRMRRRGRERDPGATLATALGGTLTSSRRLPGGWTTRSPGCGGAGAAVAGGLAALAAIGLGRRLGGPPPGPAPPRPFRP